MPGTFADTGNTELFRNDNLADKQTIAIACVNCYNSKMSSVPWNHRI